MNNLENTLQIETKLEKEKNNLQLLKANVDKYNDLSKSMSGILNSFEQRLGKLEQTIVPVYKETEVLQNRQKNLDATLDSLEKVLSHYNASQEVCTLIHLGPSEGNISVFLDGCDKLQKAQEYFRNNNPSSVELENVTSLYTTAFGALNNHFKALLKKHSSPMRPVDLLDLIYIEDDSSNSNEDVSSIKQLPPTTREELNTIACWLENNIIRGYSIIYAEERSDVVFRSLQMLKEHQKSGSWGNEPLKSRYQAKNESSTKKTTSARIQHIFEKKANKMLLKASQTIGQSTGFSIKKNASYADNLAGEDHITDGDQELEKYLVLLLGLQRLLVWERTLLNEIIPTQRHSDVFSKLAQNSIEMVVKDCESITSKVLRNIARKEWSSALGVFSALKNVVLLQPDIDKSCDTNQKQQLSGVLNKLKQTGGKALEQFLDVVKGDNAGSSLVGMSNSLSGVPKDATVHELTSNTIWFIEHLLDHCDVIGTILQLDSLYVNQLEATFSNKALNSEDRNRALLGIYIKKVLSELNLNIVSKCDQYSDLATKHLFRLNNIHYILKSLQSSNLLEFVAMTEPDCERIYQELIKSLKISYQKSWNPLLSHITPLDNFNKAKLKEKERQLIKDKFSNFNKTLEEICKTQKAISVPDVILREGLKRDNTELVIPQYYGFYETYSEVQFSKNADKYIKYRPQNVTDMLNSLFDDTF